MSELRFDGRVALITGAGGGLGREYALMLASRGANVVVNDLGGTAAGAGKSSKAADETVAMIRAKGGKAIADYNSVEDGDQVVKTAIDAFGRIDILVNNAGILRDRSFARISDEDWDLVHRVHLRGSFKVTRAAWPHMKKQNYGRVIMTASPSGIYGNFGQANYSAAKLGLVGLNNTLAIEGQKYNILCNTIAPTAFSRLTKDLLPPGAEEMLKAEYIAPITVFLCHESCEDTGSLFETLGGWAGKVRWQKSAGKVLRKPDQPFTPEDVRDDWAAVCDMSRPIYHKSITEGNMSAMEALSNSSSSGGGGGGGGGGIMAAKGTVQVADPFTLTHREAILYALGVGCQLTRTDKSDLKFLYEMHPDFAALPTFGVVPPFQSMQGMFTGGGALSGFNPANLLHGEHYLEVYKPFPTEGSVTCRSEIVDVVDKTSGAAIVMNVTITDEAGEPVCMNQYITFIVGAGGFGGPRSSPHMKTLAKRPSRAPDASLQSKTSESQAALYRLSGDYNPLHIDPDFAAMGGYKEPILHGLVSYGIAARHILAQYAGNDVTKFKCIKARFTKPVLPGQTIRTNMWREGNRILFECKAMESGHTVLTGGYVDLTEAVVSSAPTAGTVKPGPNKSDSGLKSDAVFAEIAARVKAMPELVKKVKALFLWNITLDGKAVAQWTLDLKNTPGSVYSGPPRDGAKPGCTLTMSDSDFMDMAAGKITAQKAFFGKKLKLGGNIMLSQKLDVVMQAAKSKL